MNVYYCILGRFCCFHVRSHTNGYHRPVDLTVERQPKQQVPLQMYFKTLVYFILQGTSCMLHYLTRGTNNLFLY